MFFLTQVIHTQHTTGANEGGRQSHGSGGGKCGAFSIQRRVKVGIKTGTQEMTHFQGDGEVAPVTLIQNVRASCINQ